MLAVGAIKETELLLTMRGIIGGIDIQEDLPALTDLLATEADKLLQQNLVQTH
jgi:hypothetical protein